MQNKSGDYFPGGAWLGIRIAVIAFSVPTLAWHGSCCVAWSMPRPRHPPLFFGSSSAVRRLHTKLYQKLKIGY